MVQQQQQVDEIASGGGGGGDAGFPSPAVTYEFQWYGTTPLKLGQVSSLNSKRVDDNGTMRVINIRYRDPVSPRVWASCSLVGSENDYVFVLPAHPRVTEFNGSLGLLQKLRETEQYENLTAMWPVIGARTIFINRGAVIVQLVRRNHNDYNEEEEEEEDTPPPGNGGYFIFCIGSRVPGDDDNNN